MAVVLLVLLLLAVAAGSMRALHDTLWHSPGSGRPGRWGGFWNSATSWRRKYKNDDPAQGARFPGATTWLVALTDGAHLSNALSWAAADGAVLLVAWNGPHRWAAVAYVVLRRAVFEPLYNWLRA